MEVTSWIRVSEGGYAIVRPQDTMETKALPPSTPAQKNGTNSSYEVSPVGGTQATEHVH